MKRIAIVCLILLFSPFTILHTAGSVEQKKANFKMPVWEGYQQVYANSATLVDVFVSYNPSTSTILDVIVMNVATQTEIGVIEWSGSITHSGGQMYASGFRVNFEPPGADYAVLNGALTML